MAPSVSRKPAEAKIRPYIRQSIVEAARRKFPTFEGSDADFIEWILSSVNAGVLSFGGQSLQHSVPEQIEADPPIDTKGESEQVVSLLDEEAD